MVNFGFDFSFDFSSIFSRRTTPEPSTAVKPSTSVLYEHQLSGRYIDSEVVWEYLKKFYSHMDLRDFEMIVCRSPSVPLGNIPLRGGSGDLQEVDAKYWIIWLPFELTEVLFVCQKTDPIFPRN